MKALSLHADLVDAGMIFGTGFAPFRGGPLYYKAAGRNQICQGRRLTRAGSTEPAAVRRQLCATLNRGTHDARI